MAPLMKQFGQPQASSLPQARQVAKPVISSRMAMHASQRTASIQQEEEAPSCARRLLLLGAAAAVLAVAQPPLPVLAAAQSSLCVDAETEEEDTVCRRNQLAGDAKKLQKSTGNYEQATQSKFSAAPNVPVADINDAYVQATLKLGDEIEQYIAADVYDKGRIPLIKNLKQDGIAWVSSYARGGSARTQSARRMYIAVDAVIGHLASNGYAPLPPPKAKNVLKTLTEARDFLAKGI